MHYDIVIVGTGMGGGTLAYALREAGKTVLLVERGDFIPSEPENWDADAVFIDGRYKAPDRWLSGSGDWYQPGSTYAVGGNTKVYGAALPRFYRSDFGEVEHQDGVSPAWPVSYDEFEPHYAAAERIYGVHGRPGPGQRNDRSSPFPFDAVPHEPQVAGLADRLTAAGYEPAHLPLGIDLQPFGNCVRCNTCDGYVCRANAKADADVRCVRPALRHDGIEILTGAYARRVLTDASGRRVTGVEIEQAGELLTVDADVVVVSCGAINSTALLLRSATDRHPRGLANGSDQLGRNFMIHNNSIMLSVDPVRRNVVDYQKTLYVNDFYESGVKGHPFPLGHIQLIGKVREQMIRGEASWAPKWSRTALTDRTFDWWLFTEDLPTPDSRVEITTQGGPKVTWRPNNQRAHQLLVREAKRMVKAAGFTTAIARRAASDVSSHQAGTARLGDDPASSVVDRDCRTHEIDNLFVVDASFFPSLPVMNPALTVAANALRVSEAVAGA